MPDQARIETGNRGETAARIREVALDLLAYCEQRGWAGYDPYDALNSRLFQAIKVFDHKWVRLAATQFNKRSPINLRPLLRVPPRQNPKGLALFLTALLKLGRAGVAGSRDRARKMANRLLALASAGHDRKCWGYDFPWQTRSALVPAGFPNLVCTTFAANALLDAHEEFGETEYVEAARSAAQHLIEDLYHTSEPGTVAGFAYPLPSMKQTIHNANFLAAGLICRVASVCREEHLLAPALQAARFSASKQRVDGSWPYGETTQYGWIDNFHTGFNLCGLETIRRYARTSEFDDHIERGLAFYRDHFFREDGAPRYYHDATFPIDIHAAAQSVITLIEFRDWHPGHAALAERVMHWTFNHLRSPTGYFYYQKKRWSTNRIPYMRWSQAWMLLALATYLEELTLENGDWPTHQHPAQAPGPRLTGLRQS